MFREKQFALAKRQAGLVATSALLRDRFAADAQALQQPFAIADRVRNGVGWLRAHPQWLVLLLAAPLVFRPRRAFGWAVRLWGGWRFWRQAQRLLHRR